MRAPAQTAAPTTPLAARPQQQQQRVPAQRAASAAIGRRHPLPPLHQQQQQQQLDGGAATPAAAAAAAPPPPLTTAAVALAQQLARLVATGAAAAALTLGSAPGPAAALLNSPNAQIPRSAEAALRRSIPAFNGDVREIQSTLERVAFKLRIPQRKPWQVGRRGADPAPPLPQAAREHEVCTLCAPPASLMTRPHTPRRGAEHVRRRCARGGDRGRQRSHAGGRPAAVPRPRRGAGGRHPRRARQVSLRRAHGACLAHRPPSARRPLTSPAQADPGFGRQGR